MPLCLSCFLDTGLIPTRLQDLEKCTSVSFYLQLRSSEWLSQRVEARCTSREGVRRASALHDMRGALVLIIRCSAATNGFLVMLRHGRRRSRSRGGAQCKCTFASLIGLLCGPRLRFLCATTVGWCTAKITCRNRQPLLPHCWLSAGTSSSSTSSSLRDLLQGNQKRT